MTGQSVLAAYRASATEAEIQATIVQGLRALGYVVLATGQGRRKARCPGCGQMHYQRGFAGNAEGLPDLYFRHPAWPPAVWVGCEVKKPGGRVRPAQRELAAAGHTFIARSWEDVTAWLAQEGTRHG